MICIPKPALKMQDLLLPATILLPRLDNRDRYRARRERVAFRECTSCPEERECALHLEKAHCVYIERVYCIGWDGCFVLEVSLASPWKLGVGYGMEMDSYKSQILDGVLVQKQNRMSQCLKWHATVSPFLVLNIHIPAYLDSRWKPFFQNLFFWSVN